MGYNTTVVVLNDALSFIEDDPEFGKNLVRAILEAGTSGKRTIDVAARSTRGGIHCNAATVIESHHADYFVTVKVGRNCGEVVPAHIPKTRKQIPKTPTGHSGEAATR